MHKQPAARGQRLEHVPFSKLRMVESRAANWPGSDRLVESGMGRLWTARACISAFAHSLLLAALSAGCATVDTEPEAQPKQPTTNGEGFGTASDRAKLQACYADAKLRDPDLSVHTTALYFAREGKLVFVDVTLPEAPELASCLSDALLSSHPFEAQAAQGSIVSGALRVDLGPPLSAPAPRPTLSEVRARYRRVTLEALRQGALHENDPIVRETLNPPPPWPTREMRAELEECREALHSGTPRVLHRDVIYLARGSRVLLAEVNIPEAPELRRCVLERILKWQSPFSGSSSEATILSGFFLDLGGPEEFPDPPGSLTAELARRRALLEHALELGLIQAGDPLLERFKATGAERSAQPQTDQKPTAD